MRPDTIAACSAAARRRSGIMARRSGSVIENRVGDCGRDRRSFCMLATGASVSRATAVSVIAAACRRPNLSAIGTETGKGGISSARNGIASATSRMVRHTLRRSATFFARREPARRPAMQASASERIAGSTRWPRKPEDASRTWAMLMTSLPCAERLCVRRFSARDARAVCGRGRRCPPCR